MNDTTTDGTIAQQFEYWDFLDGEAMACSPLGPSDYTRLCFANQYGFGGLLAFEGFWLMYNAKRLARLTKRVAPTDMRRTSAVLRRVSRATHLAKLTDVLGAELLCLSAAHLTGGHGVKYSTLTIAGQSSDLFFFLAMACFLFHTSLQMQGAKVLQGSVFSRRKRSVSDSGSGGAIQTVAARGRVIVDLAHGPGAFPMAFAFWVVLRSGVLKRSEMYCVVIICITLAGIRSLFANVLSKARAVLYFNRIQLDVGGDAEVTQRRRSELQNKLRVVIFEIVAFPIASTLIPLSVIIFGSVNSSLQWLIHNVVFTSMVASVWLVTCIMTHRYVNNCVRRKGLPCATQMTSTGESWATRYVHAVVENRRSSVGRSGRTSGVSERRSGRASGAGERKSGRTSAAGERKSRRPSGSGGRRSGRSSSVDMRDFKRPSMNGGLQRGRSSLRDLRLNIVELEDNGSLEE